MKTLLLFTLLIIAKFSFGQQWCPPGAVWTYSYYQAFGYMGYTQYNYDKDTTVEGQACKKLSAILKIKWDTDGKIHTTNIEPMFTYVKSDTVFFWQYRLNSFSPVYYFGAQPGDTITYFSSNYYCPVQDTSRIVVDSIGTLQLNNQTLKYYDAHVITRSFYKQPVRIVERIGAINNFMDPYFYCATDGDWHTLRCYQDDDFALYQIDTTKPCDFLYTIIKEEENNLSINIFPNPASQSFQLQLSETPHAQTCLQLFDALGRLVKQERIAERNTTITRNGFADGIYFWQIQQDEKNLARGKIILE